MSSVIFSNYKNILSRMEIDEHIVLFESHGGDDFGGNMYYLAKEFLLCEKMRYEVYILIKSTSKVAKNIKLLCKRFGNERIYTVMKDTVEHVQILATAKYLLTDVQFSNNFKKREGQICVQTWHGTPLKKLGYDFIDDVAMTGAQKKSFIDANIVLNPNQYTEDSLIGSYRLERYCNDSLVLDGYPRNSVLFDVEIRNEVRKSEKITNKKVYAYMPTWRGGLQKIETGNEQIMLLNKFEEILHDDEVLYVNFHRLMREHMDFSKYTRVREFPEEWETYELLAATDCLITDYSSVMFDYLCTRKKIMLFDYDKRGYLNRQGTYFDLDELPFPKYETLDELVSELSIEKEYKDEETYDKFCPYDGVDAASRVFERIINYTGAKKKIANNKKTVMLYGGDLSINDHTMRFVDLVDSFVEKDIFTTVCYLNTDFLKNPINLQVFQSPIDLMSIDYYKNNLLFDSSPKEQNDYWEQAYDIQMHNIKVDKIICYIQKCDDAVKLLAGASCDVSFVIDSISIDEVDEKELIELGKRKKVSIVKEIELLF